MTARADSWKREAFTAGAAIPYRQRFSRPEYDKLREGLVPRSMEDKWFVYFSEPLLFFHRSWTGKPVYRVKLEAATEGASTVEALCAPDVLEHGGAAYHAQLLDFLISNLVLGKAEEFPIPPGVAEPAEGVLQHHVTGTGYPERSGKGRPWWKLWR